MRPAQQGLPFIYISFNRDELLVTWINKCASSTKVKKGFGSGANQWCIGTHKNDKPVHCYTIFLKDRNV